MNKAVRDILSLALIGLGVGALMGILAAGAYATWRTGGNVENVSFGTFFDLAPWAVGYFGEPFKTGLVILAGTAAVFTVAVPALGYRKKLTSHGSAEWAKPDELRRAQLAEKIDKVRGPIYGKLGKPKSSAEFITSHDIPHSLIAAPTGSGKGVGIVIPTLLTYKGSVFCLDVKGENFGLTARRRAAMGDKVFKFSPYDPHGRTHRYNPLAYVAEVHPRRRFTESRRLASSLLIAHGNGQGFLDGAREIFAATAMLAIERGQPHISAIYDALSAPGEAFELFQRLAREVQAEEAQKIFNKYAGMESRILSSYLSVLSDGGLNLWADPAVRDATDTSDFGIQDLRRDPTSIYVVVSPNDLVPLAPLIRLFFQQTISIMQRAEPGKDEPFPVLFLLDEFASLGRMEVLQQAVTTLRGYGGRIMIVVQTLASLRHPNLYGREGAAVFLANCRMQVFMAPADDDTPDYVSKAIGDFTRLGRSKSWRSNEFQRHISEREEGARLIRPEQLRQIGTEKIVALVQNMKPVLADRVSYYEDGQLRPIFEGQTGRLPEPPSLYPEDTNPFYAARLAKERAEQAPIAQGDTSAEIEQEPRTEPTSAVKPESDAGEILHPPGDDLPEADDERANIEPEGDAQDNEEAAPSADPPTVDETVNALEGVIADKQDDLLAKIARAQGRRLSMRRGDPDTSAEIEQAKSDVQREIEAKPENRTGPGRFNAADLSSIEAAQERNRKRANG